MRGGVADIPQEQLDALQRRFPGSPRVEILKGLRLEAEGDNKAAQVIYSGLLAKDETNIVGRFSA